MSFQHWLNLIFSTPIELGSVLFHDWLRESTEINTVSNEQIRKENDLFRGEQEWQIPQESSCEKPMMNRVLLIKNTWCVKTHYLYIRNRTIWKAVCVFRTMAWPTTYQMSLWSCLAPFGLNSRIWSKQNQICRTFTVEQDILVSWQVSSEALACLDQRKNTATTASFWHPWL